MTYCNLTSQVNYFSYQRPLNLKLHLCGNSLEVILSHFLLIIGVVTQCEQEFSLFTLGRSDMNIQIPFQIKRTNYLSVALNITL